MTLYQASSGQPSPISSVTYVEAAKLAYEEDDMDAVEQYFQVATRLESNLAIPGLHLENLYIQALFEGAKGNLNAALELARLGHAAAEQMGLRGYIAVFTAVKSELLLRLGDIPSLMGWIASASATFTRCDDLLNMYGSIVYARFLIHQGDLSDAAELITRMEEAARRSDYIRQLITLLLLKALLCRSRGDSQQAHASLEEAIQLAMPQKYRRAFLDEGELMRNLLLEYQSIVKTRIGLRHDGTAITVLTFIDQLLAAFSPGVPMQFKAEILSEPLSDRELDIIRLVATGRSNQEIAEILVIALSTVKSHINNLYAKLGTNRRTEAIAIARDLGILSN
jgi:LuxR family maltose regulon positive regulatory protein